MRRGVLRILGSLVWLLPLSMAMLWLASGRETLTKPTRWVDVQVKDVFGDVYMQKEASPGPIFGYYVGLDAVASTIPVALLLLIMRWILNRRGSDETGAGIPEGPHGTLPGLERS